VHFAVHGKLTALSKVLLAAGLWTTERLFPGMDVGVLFEVLLGTEDFEAVGTLELAQGGGREGLHLVARVERSEVHDY